MRTGSKGAGPTLGVSQEDDSMAEDGDEQHPDIERHERQHHQVIEAHPDCVKDCACQFGSCALPMGPDQATLAQELQPRGTCKDDDECKDVVAGVGAGEVFEEDEGVLAPEEGHVRVRHRVSHLHRGRRRRRVIHVHVHVYLNQPIVIEESNLKQSKQQMLIKINGLLADERYRIYLCL